MKNKGDIFEVEITDIGNDGEGIGKIDGYTLFIKDAVIGDVVKAKIMKAKKNYAYAHLEEVVKRSEYRVEAKCPIARQCGGCQLQNMSYERELLYKQNKVRNNIVRLGGFDAKFVDSIMKPIIGMDEPWEYRNKAQFPVGCDKNGNVVTGFYAGRTHSIIPTTACHIGVKENEEIMEIIRSHMEENKIAPYDEVSGKGLVRHVLIRKGFTSGEIMVCLVINYRAGAGSAKKAGNDGASVEYIAAQKGLVEKLSKVKGMTSISVSINTEKTNVIMGLEIHTIYGKDTISDTLCGLEFEISPLSFFQVNPVQTKKLYEQAIEYAGLTGKETVWDLYCGIGTITLSMAKAAGRVYGIEVIPEAIEDAKRNALRNGITNAEFYCGKAEEVLPKFYDKKRSVAGSTSDGAELRPDVIVVDPPRKGCDAVCLETMLKMQPERIVYVSCDSATLARDLRILADGGYELKAVRPCDMFPWTVHVETVVQLSKGNINKGSSERSDAVKAGDFGVISGYSKGNKAPETTNVKIDFSLENLDLSELRGKATYEQIKDYVREQTGFRVSALYISQVKRKCGLEVGESYNKPKSEDSKQPQCTPEKEEAIMQALRHYGVI
ncbi:23S rRNA (uracil(1939)-C(5))-methyltransferase RlmD [Butyrivibrio sp. INlla21]|uniref:23S rRNA (uracil(1939)-C(5))-methyltransferase RlmD n=1 Tax=Butyrivibrio sp. INlla21 TaxID=1520811 RepID=UPI0008F0A992|nr:23S rRNA (uracil(1939)-C(5))-methyltransferase RlmD [Butyrivibrio sp. INlla21]SFU74904.1 23S rRNA (uracil1939-C5)-methyltransferase [Butyrivibrio sp. INlla21]